MKSRLPKVLHRVAGLPMVTHVCNAAREAGVRNIVVVVGHGRDVVAAALDDGVRTADQVPQLGSADAVARALPLVTTPTVLVLNGDLPLIRSETITALLRAHAVEGAHLSVATIETPSPTGYGRILRDSSGNVLAIREESDASAEERRITEVNGGAYLMDAAWLRETLPALPKSAKGEFYLTDAIAAAASAGVRIATSPSSEAEMMGINNRVQLAAAEAVMRQRIREEHMLAGVTIVDPATTYIDAGVTIGQDTVIHPNTSIQGATAIGGDCEIGPGSYLLNAVVGDRCRVFSSVVENSRLGSGVAMGPWCRVRGGAVLDDDVDMGNFAEIKKSKVGRGTKMHHFSYMGDAIVGERVNIGAGMITCNYDGVHKNTTVIGDGAFIGSDSMLVAPLTIGADAATGAGAVVTKDVPDGMLAVGVPARNFPRKKLKPEDEGQ